MTDNPAKPIRNPRPDRKLPHFLTTEEISRLLGGAAEGRAVGASRPGDSGNDLLGRPAESASWWESMTGTSTSLDAW